MGRSEELGMNLNTAAARELTQLPRIGADKARKIVHYRAIRKGFRDWGDFARTPGITEEDVEAIRTRACIGPSPDGIPTPAGPSHLVRGRIPVRRPRPKRPYGAGAPPGLSLAAHGPPGAGGAAPAAEEPPARGPGDGVVDSARIGGA